jgi:hypothetical protein
VIDLGDVRDQPRATAGVVARPPVPIRTVMAVLAVLLLSMLAGAAHLRPPTPPKIIPARLGDAMFVTGDRLFLVGAGPSPQIKIISAYALPAGALLTRTTVTVTGAIFDVTAVGRTVLVSYQVDSVGAESTVALEAGTDHAIWRRPARMNGVSAAGDLVLLRENSPQFGPLHWYGVDLTTGALRWSLEQPVRGYLTEVTDDAGFPGRLVSVDADGTLLVRDAGTGAITARSTIPVPADWARRGIALWPDGDLILVGDHTGATAYGLGDLAARWHTTVDLYSSYPGPGCGDAICLFGPRGAGVTVLDRGTGHIRWTSDRWSYGQRSGPDLVTVGGSQLSDQHLGVVDIATGRPRGDFGPWRPAGPLLPDGTIVGLHDQPVDNIVWYALLDPSRLGVRMVGSAAQVSGDCSFTAGVLVCRRTDASVGIWRLTGRGDGR